MAYVAEIGYALIEAISIENTCAVVKMYVAI